jgi:surface protein
LFYEKTFFNDDISDWDVSNVRDMRGMFIRASQFDQHLDKWHDKLGEVQNMHQMFHATWKFNGSVANWKMPKVTDMSSMFSFAKSFEGKDLEDWDVSNVQNMQGMFHGASKFNADLSGWNVSKVTDMSQMFYQADAFKGTGLSEWILKQPFPKTKKMSATWLSWGWKQVSPTSPNQFRFNHSEKKPYMSRMVDGG